MLHSSALQNEKVIKLSTPDDIRFENETSSSFWPLYTKQMFITNRT